MGPILQKEEEIEDFKDIHIFGPALYVLIKINGIWLFVWSFFALKSAALTLTT
jgi:hypothetical protein